MARDATDPPAPVAAPWMREAPVRRVLAALAEAGGPARFVGGCVRDTLLGRPVADIDLATPLPPDRVVAAAEKAGLHAVPTGIAHGTVTLVADGRPFEVTTLRRDVETDGRHAVVAFTDDWRADAGRRDFTLNALSVDGEGRLHDYFGGLDDARAGRIRFVGDAGRRVAEDRLRVLRFFRFFAHYGRPPPDAEALAACRAAAGDLGQLSGERVRQELLKLLAAPDPMPAWRLMAEAGVARATIGEPGNAPLLAGLVSVESAPDPLRRLAALVTVDDEGAARLAERLRLSNAERDRLVALRAAPPLAADLSVAALRAAAYREGPRIATDRLLLGWAAAPKESRYAPLLAALGDWTVPRFPVKGADAVAADIPAGPAVGAALRSVEDWWIAEDFVPDRAACLAELRRRAGERAGADST